MEVYCLRARNFCTERKAEFASTSHKLYLLASILSFSAFNSLLPSFLCSLLFLLLCCFTLLLFLLLSSIWLMYLIFLKLFPPYPVPFAPILPCSSGYFIRLHYSCKISIFKPGLVCFLLASYPLPTLFSLFPLSDLLYYFPFQNLFFFYSLSYLFVLNFHRIIKAGKNH